MIKQVIDKSRICYCESMPGKHWSICLEMRKGIRTIQLSVNENRRHDARDQCWNRHGPVAQCELFPIVKPRTFKGLVNEYDHWQTHRHFFRIESTNVEHQKERQLWRTQRHIFLADTNVITQRGEIEKTTQHVV